MKSYLLRTLIVIGYFFVTGNVFAQDNVEPDWMHYVIFQNADHKVGYMDARTGKVVIQPIYVEGSCFFYSGLATVSHVKDGKVINEYWDVVNDKGEVQFTIKSATFPGSFRDGDYLYVGDVRFDRKGNMERLPNHGHLRVDGLPDDSKYPAEGDLIKLQEKGAEYFGLVDNNLNVVLDFDYMVLGDFHEGLAFFQKGGRGFKPKGVARGYINTRGEEVISFPDSVLMLGLSSTFGDGRAWIQTKTTLTGKGSEVAIIDKEGKIVAKKGGPGIWVFMGPFRHGMAAYGTRFKKSFGLGYVDLEGNEVIPQNYDEAYCFEDFGDGNILAKVKKGNCWGYINQKNEEVIPVKYYDLGPFVDGLACFSMAQVRRVDAKLGENKYYGFINLKGEEVIPMSMPRAGKFEAGRGYAAIDIYNPHGLPGYKVPIIIDKTGKIVNKQHY